MTLRDSGGNVFGGAAQVAGLLEDSRIISNKACFSASAIVLDGGTVQNNYFDDNVSACFSPPVISGEGSIIGNEFDDTGHSPPIGMNDDSPTVERNYFHDPGVVMQVLNHGDPLIRNNLIVASSSAIDGLIDLNHGSTSGNGPTIVNN